MSAEAPNGTGDPTPPQKSKGRFSGLLVSFFRGPDQKPIGPGTPSTQHPPAGLENFAAKIQQGIDSHLAAQKQQEVDTINARVAAEAEKARVAAEAAARQRDLAEQNRIRVEKAAAECADVLKDFKIAERLEYIRQNIWKGRGEIRPIQPARGLMRTPETTNHGHKPQKISYDNMGGLELVFEYPTIEYRREWSDGEGYGWKTCGPDGGGGPVRITSTMHLGVNVLKLYEDSGDEKKVLKITSDQNDYYGVVDPFNTIPIDIRGGEPTLEATIVRYCVYSITNGLPSARERHGSEAITTASKKYSNSR